MSVKSTRSSELATIAAEAAGADTASVRFTILHGPDRPGLEPLWEQTGQADGAGQGWELWPTDFSLFSAAGLSVCAGTWPSAASTFSGTVHVDQPMATDRLDTCSHSGLTVPNPGFLNESTRRIDVLVTAGSTHWSPSYRDALMNCLVIKRLSGLAQERAGGPVLHLQTPVAPFQDQRVSERGDGSNERLRDAIGPCIRLSVGMDPNMAAARLDFEAGLASLAEEYGLGLKLDDRRFNRVRGEWFTIRGFDRERHRRERGRLFPHAPMRLPKRAVLATVVGPARVGMTARVTGALLAHGIGVLAASIFIMRKIAFVNLILPAPDDAGPAVPAWSGDWDQAIATLVDRCAGDRWQISGESGDEGRITDHKVALSAPIRCSYPPSSRRTGASMTGRVPYPLWLRWEVPWRTVDTPWILGRLRANLEPYTQQCEVAYAHSRVVRGDTVGGRAKLIVVLADGHRDHAEAERALTGVAERAQERTLEQLQAVPGIEAGRSRMRLSPRERWLAYGGTSD